MKTVFPTNDIGIKEGKNYELIATVDNNFSIKKYYTVMLPRTEFGVEFSNEEYQSVGKPQDLNIYKFYEWKYFRVRLYPIDVSFEGIYLWEIGDFGIVSGVFSDKDYIPAVEYVHMPANPVRVNDINETSDMISLKLSEILYTKVMDYYLANKDILSNTEIYIEDEPVVQTILGKIIWNCPVRWSLSEPGIDDRTVTQCIAENVVKNQILKFDGTVLSREQEMTLHYTTIPTDSSLPHGNFMGSDLIKTFGNAD